MPNFDADYLKIKTVIINNDQTIFFRIQKTKRIKQLLRTSTKNIYHHGLYTYRHGYTFHSPAEQKKA